VRGRGTGTEYDRVVAQQYFAESPDARHREGTVDVSIDGRPVRLRTDAGVFSAERLDPGTAVLLDTVPDPPSSGDLLDIGCGYGPIAITMALKAPQATVWAVDVNERARELTRANAENAGCRNVTVSHPDEVPADIRFAAIWSNPPIRIGKEQLHELLGHWLVRLDGDAYLVVQKHLGSDSLQRWLTENGWPCEKVRSRKAFRVLRAGRDD
jgi:16S rRNA (guanine1207-N2)-methyltransferase